MSPPTNRLARLDDYLSGHMDDRAAGAFEEELFELAAADDDARFVDELARLLVLMAASGGLAGGSTRAQVDALRAAGLRVHFVDLGPGGASDFPAWQADTQIVVARLGVDLRGYEGVDIEVETNDGRPIKTFRDVSCDPTDGALYAICQEPLARMAFGRHIIGRVVAARAGVRQTVAVFDVRPA